MQEYLTRALQVFGVDLEIAVKTLPRIAALRVAQVLYEDFRDRFLREEPIEIEVRLEAFDFNKAGAPYELPALFDEDKSVGSHHQFFVLLDRPRNNGNTMLGFPAKRGIFTMVDPDHFPLNVLNREGFSVDSILATFEYDYNRKPRDKEAVEKFTIYLHRVRDLTIVWERIATEVRCTATPTQILVIAGMLEGVKLES